MQHFGTREKLFRAVLKALSDQHPPFPEVQERMEARDDERVFACLAADLIEHGKQDTTFVRLALYSALEGPHVLETFTRGEEEERPTLEQFLARYIDTRIEEGALGEVNAEATATLFLGAVHYYVSKQALSGRAPAQFSHEEEAKTLVTAFLDGLQC